MKLNIGICEDMEAQQRSLRHMLEEWSVSRGEQIQVSVYADSSAFWFDWCGKMDLDVLLLDIDLGQGQMNGMELARKIREKDSRIVIIFITALTEYMSQGYDVQALHFLVKPVEKARLWEVLDRAFTGLNKRKEYLLLEEETDLQLIPVDDILYAEAFSHSVALHLFAGKGTAGTACREVRTVGLKELEERLPKMDFFRCHRSYLVHLAHVNRISKNEVILDDGSVLPVSRRREREFYRVFLEYYREREKES